MYLSVGVVLHYAQVHQRCVCPLVATGLSFSDNCARNVIRITLAGVSISACASMAAIGATPRFLRELSQDYGYNENITLSLVLLPLENAALIFASIIVNVTLRILILREASKVKCKDEISEDKRLSLGFLAASLSVFLVVMLGSVVYGRFYVMERGQDNIDRKAIRRIFLLFVAVVVPVSAVMLHTRIRRIAMKNIMEALELAIFEVQMIKRRVRKILAGALVIPYIDSEDGNEIYSI